MSGGPSESRTWTWAHKLMRKDNKSFDVVVIGGGLAGICAAIAASRLGAKTALIHDRPVLGGNNSSEIRVGISGADCSGFSLTRYSRETGIINELATENLYRNLSNSSSVMDVICWERVKKEKNLTLFLNSYAEDAIMSKKNIIVGINIIQTSTGRHFSVTGKIFIDCSGDGTIAARTGAKYRIGREAKKEFKESLALDKADKYVMGSTLVFFIKDMGYPVSFVPPAWAYRFPTDKDLPFRPHNIKKEGTRGFWWMAYGGVKDTIKDNDKIYEELLKILFGLWDHIKNCGDHGAENMVLDWISPLPGKRESRRFIGEHILNENEIRNHVLFPDRVAYGGWPIDIHPPEGIYSLKPPNTSVPLKDLYSIPFSSLYSRNIQNLLFAGRNISVTHVALGSTRVMGTCAVIGQAAGTAAYLCIKHNLIPRELRKSKIKELQQQLLKDGCYVPGIRNEDPFDLARKAAVSASSEGKLRAEDIAGFESLETPCAQLFPVSENHIESIELYLKSTLPTNKKVQLKLYQATSVNDFSSEKEIAKAEAIIPAGKELWVKFDLKSDIESIKLYWISVLPVDGISWGYQKEAPVGTNRAVYVKDFGWKSKRESYAYRLHPDSYPYSAVNVVNGVTRPEAWPNLWISDRGKPLPQTLDIVFNAPRKVGTIHVTFDAALDTNIYLSRPYGILGASRVVKECARDYALYFSNGRSWKKIIQVKDNYHRHRVHHFKTISAKEIRLKITSTNGVPEARVYEIRVYGEKGKRE